MPSDTTIEELKELIARAASPKVAADDVSIAFTNSNDPYLTPDRQQNLPKPDESGNPWWLALALSGVGLVIIFNAISSKVKSVREENEAEVEALRQRAMEQERQLSDINSRASQLTQRQSELAQDLINQQQRAQIPQFDENLLIDSLDSISNEITEDAADNIKSWIEEGSTKEGIIYKMATQNFDYEAFAQNLAAQAQDLVPADFDDSQKQYVINTLGNFSLLSGKTIAEDPNLNFNEDQAVTITQIIAEWSFHKSVDVIRSGIPQQYWDGIMQKLHILF